MPETRPLRGILLVALAALAFALTDVTGKYLVERYPVPVVMVLRYLVNLSLLVAILAPRHGTGIVRTRRTFLVILRGLSLAAASLTMGLALQVMPVAETIAIIYLAPFGVLLVAGPLLGERPSLFAWVAAGVGFAGVMLIVRPGSGLAPLGVLLALVNACFSASYQVLSRLLSRSESMASMLVWTAAIGVAVFGALLPFVWRTLSPTPVDMALFLGLGIVATLGHFLFTAGYREAPASVLAPVNYLHLVWAGLFGWMVFDHLPAPLALVGMVLVAGAGIAVALRARRAPTAEPV